MDEAQTNQDEQGVAHLKINNTSHQNHDPNNKEKMSKRDKKKKKKVEEYDGEVDAKDNEGIEDLRTLGVSADEDNNKVDEDKKKKKKNKAMEIQFGSNESREKTEEKDVTGVKNKEDIYNNNGHNDPPSKLEKKNEKKKKKKKREKEKHNKDYDCPSQSTVDVSGHSENLGAKRERNKSKKKHKGDSSFAQEGGAVDSPAGNTNALCDDAEYASKGKKRKANSQENVPTPSKSNKKVRFSGQDEVFTLPDHSNVPNDREEDDLVRGKRFKKEEDAIIKEAVYSFIENHNLGEDGLEMVLHTSKYRQLIGCWRQIGAALPHRPYSSVYCRAQVLFRRSDKRKWTKEEIEMIIEHQAKHGNQWKELADELGTHPWHVKDAWRRSKLRNRKMGHWSQEEYQKLFNLVNADLQLKVHEEKHSKHGMLRDNIPWTAISDQVATRGQASCFIKWYGLRSRLVEKDVWADVDDYRLLDALYGLDASCMEDVDWDNILDNRSADLCLQRWNEMVLHIGHHGNKSFSEQVDVLAQRYCPKLIEARDTWDNKPRVP